MDMGALMHTFRRFIVAIVALTFAAGGCFLDQPYKHRGPTKPENLGDGWSIATPASVGIDEAVLAAIHDEILREDRHFGILGLLIIKSGQLVFETYTRSLADRDRYHAIQSATKSVTSLILGAVRDRGLLPPLDTTLCSILGSTDCAGLEPQKQQITLEHLLTMRSGIAFDNDDFSTEIMVDKPANPLHHILSKPMYAAPGERYYYRDADPQLIVYALQRLTGRTEESLAVEYFFGAMGITHYLWETVPDGASTGAFALHLRPRDLAKFGQLMLDGGKWAGAQLLSPEWCTLATTAKVATFDGPTDNPLGYGYYFWVPTTPSSYAFWGTGGQFVLVVPAKQLVLVQVGLPDASGEMHGSGLLDFIALTRPLWQ
jgi:CubicO group peptidase (beta-lactamase class C family)